MILVRDDLDFKLHLAHSDDNGRYIIMEAEVKGSLFLFENSETELSPYLPLKRNTGIAL